ncbi:MAG: MFS transporter [Pseudobdellovibrionaceae bacterium]
MKSREMYLYLSRLFTGFAGWLVFLAIALMVKDEYGSNKVPWVFLIQSLPPLLLSNWLASKTTESKMKNVFLISQFISIVALLFLNKYFSIYGIYSFVLINSLVQTMNNPILVSMAMKSVGQDRWQAVHTRLTSIQSSTLAIAPIFGGWFSMSFGFASLILLTALIGIFGLVFMFFAIPPLQDSVQTTDRTQSSFLQKWRPLIIQDKDLKTAIGLWSIFLFVGGLLNTIEFPVFEIQSLSHSKIGFMLGAWGFGNLLVFATSYKKKAPLTALQSCSLFALTLFLFIGTFSFTASLVSFFIGGFLNSYIAGILRNKISSAIPTRVRPLDVWAAVNQRMSLINIFCYGLGGYALKFISVQYLGALMLVFALLLIFALFKTNGSLWRKNKISGI